MTNSKRALGRLLGGASVAALSMAVLLPATAFAQEAQATAQGGAAPAAPAADPAALQPQASGGPASTQLGAIVVTGSRIARKDYTSNSPIVTMNSQALSNQSDLQIQDTLNKLPQFTPSQNFMGSSAVDVQGTPNHSIGIATLSLRGLGANRNLVLIDGQRAAPVNGEGVVDVSTIPASMIDRVETITGGASAVYGPDAVGGVVNFIMKKNFHGVDLDVQEGVNQTGDGHQFQASAVFGTNFADDKGNVTVALERFTNDASYERDHSFFTKRYNDPTMPGNGFFPFGASWAGSSAQYGLPSQGAVNSIFGPGVSTSANFWVNNGQLYTGLAGSGVTTPIRGATPAINGTTVANYQGVISGTSTVIPQIKDNETIGYIQPPLERWSMFTNGHYDFNEWISANFQADFSQTHTNTVLTAPASFVGGWNVYVPYNQVTDDPASAGYIAPGQPGAQHPVPGQLATLLNSRTGGATAPWALSWLPSLNGPLTPRSTQDINTVYQIRAGLKGKLPNVGTLENWTWSLDGSHSESDEYDVGYGDYSLQRYQALITAPNWGTGTLKGNYTQPNGSGGTILSPNAGFGMGNGVSCTSGFYNTLFNNAPLSADCLADVQATHQSMNITKQDTAELDLSGDLFKLPAGTVKASLGADYRRYSLQYNPDTLQSDTSFLDQIVGVYPTGPVNASQDVKEGYGELFIPILADLPFIKSFSINPGLRYSSYDTSNKGTWTWKGEGTWEVNDWFRFRGSYNVAVRSPNIGELYLPQTEFFGAGSSYGDPCSLLSTAPWGAGGAAPTAQQLATNPNAKSAVAVTNTKGAAGAANTLAICNALIQRDGGTNAVQQYYQNAAINQPAPGPQIFSWNNESGTQGLKPETAKTWTVGIVLKSPFQQSPLLSRFNLSVDYYKIHITDAIEYASVDYVYQNCFNQPGVAAALASPYCQDIQRSNVGAAQLVDVPEQNLATIDTSGVDLALDWSANLSDIWKNAPGRISISESANFLGNYDTIAYPGATMQKWYGTLGPNLSGLDAGAYSYRLSTSFGYAVGPAVINLTWRHYPQINAAASVSPGNTTLPTAAYDIVDLSTIWSLPHGLQLRAGISNLFDAQPPTTGQTTGQVVGGLPLSLAQSGQGVSNASYYDEFGRRFYVGLKARF
jgi:iron complex outermembrane receptor protein